MKKLVSISKPLLITVMATWMVTSFHHALAQERVTYKSAKSSSSYYQMAVQIAEINKDTGLQVTVEESQGSVQNVKEALIRQGNYVFTTPPGLITSALNGKEPFKENKKFEEIRGLFPIPALTMHYVMDAQSNVTKFSDFTNESIIIGKGSFSAREAKRVFELFNLNDVELIDVELDSAVSALKNGKVDGFVTASSWPTPSVVETVASRDINLVTMTEDEVTATGSARTVIPANTYSGVTTDTLTTSLPVGAYTTTQMSDEVAYQLTKTFWQSKDEMAKSSPWWNGVIESSIATLSAPIHPGAQKYYDEVGLNTNN